MADTAELTDTFVQTVPDKCDRIVWRGRYYTLPALTPTHSAEDAAVLVDELMKASASALHEATPINDALVRMSKARAAVLARMAGKVPTWQPIETAPKDGTHLLLRCPPFEIKDGPSFYVPATLTGYYDTIDDAFCVTTANWRGPFIKPSHWQPLPAAPEAPR